MEDKGKQSVVQHNYMAGEQRRVERAATAALANTVIGGYIDGLASNLIQEAISTLVEEIAEDNNRIEQEVESVLRNCVEVVGIRHYTIDPLYSPLRYTVDKEVEITLRDCIERLAHHHYR